MTHTPSECVPFLVSPLKTRLALSTTKTEQAAHFGTLVRNYRPKTTATTRLIWIVNHPWQRYLVGGNRHDGTMRAHCRESCKLRQKRDTTTVVAGAVKGSTQRGWYFESRKRRSQQYAQSGPFLVCAGANRSAPAESTAHMNSATWAHV